MSKPISWSNRLHEIRDRVRRSKLQSWNRREIEALFEIKRASAQNLMKAIGGLHNVGGTHLVDSEAILAFLERSIASENLSKTVQESRLDAGPAPRPQRITFTLPPELRSVMSDDLPANISFEPGRLTITGADSVEVIEGLYLLAQAMQNDLVSIQARLDLPPASTPNIDNDLAKYFGV